jgi:hypothetical protein
VKGNKAQPIIKLRPEDFYSGIKVQYMEYSIRPSSGNKLQPIIALHGEYFIIVYIAYSERLRRNKKIGMQCVHAAYHQNLCDQNLA